MDMGKIVLAKMGDMQTTLPCNINDIMKDNFDSINELSTFVLKTIKKDSEEYRCYKDAMEGKLTFRRFKKLDDTNSDISKVIHRINELQRLNYYIYYRYSSNYIINCCLSEAIQKYKDVLNSFAKFKIDYKDIPWSTSDLNCLLKVREIREEWYRDSNPVYVLGTIWQGNAYSPICFDVDYSTISMAIDYGKGNTSESNYCDMQDLATSVLRKLHTMDSDSYRKHKLSQMKLTEDERKSFDSHIAEYLSSKQDDDQKNI